VTPLLTPIIMRTYGFQVLLARRGLVNLALVDWLGLTARPLPLLSGPYASVVAMVHVLVPSWCCRSPPCDVGAKLPFPGLGGTTVGRIGPLPPPPDA
jgi:hypothetical protein